MNDQQEVKTVQSNEVGAAVAVPSGALGSPAIFVEKPSTALPAKATTTTELQYAPLLKKGGDLDEILFVKSVVAPTMSSKQFIQLMFMAKAYGLDPLQKDIAIIDFKGVSQTILTINAYRKIADSTGQHAGTSFRYFWTDSTGKRTESEFKPSASATIAEVICTVKRKRDGQVTEYTGKAEYSEEVKGTPKAQWADRPVTMLEKVAETRALRRGFPQMGGSYTADELGADAIDVQSSDVS